MNMPFAADTALSEASLSSALASVFRGKFCDIVLRDRSPLTYAKDAVLYEMGDSTRSFFFILRGFVKVGTVTKDGREVIYDVRSDGDVAGELSVSNTPRRDRAVALEDTQAVPVPYLEIADTLEKHPGLALKLVELLCDSLSQAYAQIDAFTDHDVQDRLVTVLRGLADKIGRPDGPGVQIPMYLTQEEISHMVAARRERVSTALNLLRRRGFLQYSNRGYLVLLRQ